MSWRHAWKAMGDSHGCDGIVEGELALDKLGKNPRLSRLHLRRHRALLDDLRGNLRYR